LVPSARFSCKAPTGAAPAQADRETKSISVTDWDSDALREPTPQKVYPHHARPASGTTRGTLLKMTKRQRRSRYRDWTPQVDTKTIHRPAATRSVTLALPDRVWRMCCLPSSGVFDCRIHARTQMNEISLICSVITEKLAQYHDAARLIEFAPFCKLVKATIQKRHRTFSSVPPRRITKFGTLSSPKFTGAEN
jgi:hypothetical protein